MDTDLSFSSLLELYRANVAERRGPLVERDHFGAHRQRRLADNERHLACRVFECYVPTNLTLIESQTTNFAPRCRSR